MEIYNFFTGKLLVLAYRFMKPLQYFLFLLSTTKSSTQMRGKSEERQAEHKKDEPNMLQRIPQTTRILFLLYSFYT